MKRLLIGDWHATAEELDECRRLAEYTLRLVDEQKIKHVSFLGDQYHTHALVNVRVMEFWLWFFGEFEKRGVTVIGVVGNHDQPGSEDSTAHAMLPHARNVQVVDRPMLWCADDVDLLYLPYYPSEEQFREAIHTALNRTVLDFDHAVLICHQTFNGCTYENGFYAKDGFDLETLSFQTVISGHIHAPQNIGKLWYPGAPRWRSVSDANTVRGLYVVEFTGAKYVITRYETAPYCRVIHHVEVTPESPEVPDASDKDLFVVDVKGPAEWIESMQPKLQGRGHRVRIIKTGSAAISIRESEGIQVSFRKYTDAWAPKFGTDKAVLAKMAEERLGL